MCADFVNTGELLMTFEQLENASKKALRYEVVSRFNRYNESSPRGIEQLWEAQFYMSEIDRRASGWIATRDLLLEIVVIILIGAEIWLAVKQGKDEGILMDKQNAILNNLQVATAATVTEIKNLGSTSERTYAVTTTTGKQL